MHFQTTIRRTVRFASRTLYSGRPTGVRFVPAPADMGIVFNQTIPACIDCAYVTNHLVGLRKGRAAVRGVEHILAACYGLGIDNLHVEVNGPELPFGDGSARPFARLLRSAGLRRLGRPVQRARLVAPVLAADGRAFICALPRPGRRPGLAIDYFIRFASPEVGNQHWHGFVTRTGFEQDLAAARTFGRWNGVIPAWLAPSVQVRDRFVTPRARRFGNEPVRHKALDLLGDLALLGARLEADVFAFRAGHALHHKLVRALTSGRTPAIQRYR
jgi:UDP-3-O-[3-hydroxymyristoyl] N-acetylglucosamine deacetylase